MGVRDGASIVLERDMANVAVARQFVRTQLGDDVSGVALDDLILATSELVTNAFEHGADASTTIAVRLGPGEASITVSSRTDSTGAQVDAARLALSEQWSTVRPEQLNGRGLGIVRRLADRVDVVQVDDTLQITIVRQLSASF